jgi:hypothetical protein
MFLSSRLLEVVSGVRVWVANPHYVGYRGNDAGRRVGRVYIYDLTRFPSTTDKNKKRHTQTENIPSYRFGPTGSDIRSMPQLWNFHVFLLGRHFGSLSYAICREEVRPHETVDLVRREHGRPRETIACVESKLGPVQRWIASRARWDPVQRLTLFV